MRLPVILALAATAAAPAPRISVSGAWFRYIVPQVPAGGYMQVHGASTHAAVLVGATSPACGMLMMHESTESAGSDQMMEVGSVLVPAGGTVAFKPGGYHLMCMAPRMKAGESVPVTLRFADGEAVTARFEVFGATGRPVTP